MITFGPLQSRRLGRSLGINNVQPKSCSYSCVYCQVGATRRKETDREEFFTVDEIAGEVREKIAQSRHSGRRIDYVTFVPGGEPTLDSHLGESIRAVRELGVQVAVLTNGSLLSRKDVREELMAADLVSIKVDSIRESVWRRVNRPSHKLDFASILDGVMRFAGDFRGRLLTETMVVAEMNDNGTSMHALGRFLARLDPFRAYLTTPIRPPATRIEAPSDRTMARLFAVLANYVPSAGLLLPGCPVMLSSSGDPRRDLLSAVAVHPLSEDSVAHYIESSAGGWKVVDELVERGELRRRPYASEVFFVPGEGASSKARTRAAGTPKRGRGAA